MHPLFQRRLRPIAVVILVFFSWFCIEPWNFAIAAPPAKPAKVSSKEKGTSEKLEESLHKIKNLTQTLDQDLAADQEIQPRIDQLAEQQKNVAVLDAAVLNEFAETEAFLKGKHLPAEILDRHAKALAEYQQNIQTLRKNLDDTIRIHGERKRAKGRGDLKGADQKKGELRAKLKAARSHLEEKVKERPHQKLDPNNLPHRMPKVKERAPRLKKEEFTEFQKPVQLVFNGDPSSLMLVQSTQDLPTPADLAENLEVQFTPEIQALATELAHNPVKIYNWVHNNIDFVPTYGSIQGANHCLATKQCNNMDTASLLIALLRVSGISARYVYGTIEVPVAQAMNWVGGFTDPMSAANFIASAGTPGAIIRGGGVSAIQMEHTWVEAYVDYFPSRGAVHKQGDTWVPMDGSFKQFTFTSGIDLKTAVPFDVSAFINQLRTTAIIDEQQGFVSNIDPTFIQTTLTGLQAQLQNYLDSNLPNGTLEDLIGKKTIKVEESTYLPGTLPYKILVTGSRMSSLIETHRHKLTIEVATEAFFGIELNFTAYMSELVGKRVTFSYVPATAIDQQTVNTYGGLYNTPAYLIQVKPQLKIEGVIKGEGNAVGMGMGQNLTMIFSLPNQGIDQVQNIITAAGYYAIGLTPGRLPASYSEVLRHRAQQLDAFVKSGGDRRSDTALGEQLYLSAMTYFFEVDSQSDLAASAQNVVYAKNPGEGIFALSLSVLKLFGVPESVNVNGVNIDVDRSLYLPFSKAGDFQVPVGFMSTVGLISSGGEHGIIEHLYHVDGISAVKAIHLANQQGLKIFNITASNLSTVIQSLNVPDAVKTDIKNSVNAGKEVQIPEREIQVSDWKGVGYIISEPKTGEGAYIISGGTAGGAGTQVQPLDQVLDRQAEDSFICFLGTLALPLLTVLVVVGILRVPAVMAAFSTLGLVGVIVFLFYIAFTIFLIKLLAFYIHACLATLSAKGGGDGAKRVFIAYIPRIGGKQWKRRLENGEEYQIEPYLFHFSLEYLLRFPSILG